VAVKPQVAVRGTPAIHDLKLELANRLAGDWRSRYGQPSLVAPRTDPDERSLAHPVLIADRWQRSERRERDGALVVEVTNAEPERECASTRSDVSGYGVEEHATRAQAPDPETPPGS